MPDLQDNINLSGKIALIITYQGECAQKLG